MSRRIDIELTSSRDDGSWTWRAAGAREPRGTLDGVSLPPGVQVGDVVRAEIEAHLDGISVVAIMPPRAPKAEPERLELKASSSEGPLVTSTLVRKGRGDRGDRRHGDRDRGERRRSGRDRDRQDSRHERTTRPATPPEEAKPKPKRLRPGKVHRSALLESLPAEQRPIAEQVLQGGIPSVRQAIDKQNEDLRAEGKPEVKADALLKIAEDLRPKTMAALWRDRAEAAVETADEIDLRDLRSVVNAADDAGRDDESRDLAARLRAALIERVEKEHAAWLAELGESLRDGRVVRALRLSSRPPKAGAPIPGDLSNQLVETTSQALTADTGPDRWATVLDALAYSPIRRRVVPQSLPTRLSDDLRKTIARLGTRLPEIAHIFAIEPEVPAGRDSRPGRRKAGQKGGEGERGARKPGAKRGRGSSGGKGKRSNGPDATATKPEPAEGAKPESAEGVKPELDKEAAPEAAEVPDAPQVTETTTASAEDEAARAADGPESDEAQAGGDAAPAVAEAAKPATDAESTPSSDKPSDADTVS